jgi:hypothetical protein
MPFKPWMVTSSGTSLKSRVVDEVSVPGVRILRLTVRRSVDETF